MKNQTKTKKKKKKVTKQKTKKRIQLRFLESNTPPEIRQLSNRIANRYLGSYRPTINNELVSLNSIPREPLLDCNIKAAYQLTQPLEIGIPGNLYGKYCYNYNSAKAKQFLLKNLSANKHVNISKIVPPIQTQGNCWFNAFFMSFFVSDKGRKFFHYFRQLMIEGRQTNGDHIPENLRHAFALLNFGIDACLTGNQFAYELDTNSVIHQLYHSIPTQHRSAYMVDAHSASNPIMYYISIINYLNNDSLSLFMMRHVKDEGWKTQVAENIKNAKHLPHIIVLEIFDDYAGKYNKPMSFYIDDSMYKIDSAVVRDTTKQHFCTLLTCEGTQMGYDGMSFKRMVPFEWKDKLNISQVEWQFADTNNAKLKWNFTKSYQLLMYYRVS